MRIDRGRRAWLQRSGSGIETMSTGKAVFTLWNENGRYDGWNASSDLYPNVTYGKDLRIRVRDIATGTIEDVFFGVISDIVPTSYGEKPQVKIYVEDGFIFLRNYSASVNIQTDISPDTAIGLVLDDVGWPTRWGRSLDASLVDEINYFWADGERLAATECEDIANSFFGYFFIDAQGQARFVSRTTIGGSVADFDQADIYKDISNPQPWVNQRNVMKIKVHPHEASGTALLYEYFGVPKQILAGQSSEPIFAAYTFNGQSVAAMSIVTPVAVVDYAMNTAADGSGTDKTANCTVTATNLGGTAKIIITNNSASTIHVTKLNVRGVAIYEKSPLTVTYPSDPSTVTQPRQFVMDLPWQQSSNQATDFCTVIGPFLDGLHPFPTIQVESNFSLQFGIELFDIVTLTSDRLGIDGVSFRVGGIEHESMTENCQRIRTTFYLEPYVGGGTYMTWPGTWGTDTVFGW